MMIMHAFGTGTASDQAVTVAAATFKGGLSGIWYQWLWLFVTPFYWLIAPVFRRFRAVTTADVYELRFDRSVAVLFALVGIANMSVKIGLMLKGTGVLIESATGTWVDTELAILAVTFMFVLYGAAGGLAAAIVTDYVQGILTILFSVMLLPFILNAVGGMQGVRETITDPHMLSLVAPGKVTWFFVVMMSLQALVGIVAQPFIMGVCAAGKTEWEGRVGFTVGNLVKRVCTIAWSLTAIAAVAWYLQRGIDLASIEPDHVYGEVAQAFLPKAAPGAGPVSGRCAGGCDEFLRCLHGLQRCPVYRKRLQTSRTWTNRKTLLVDRPADVRGGGCRRSGFRLMGAHGRQGIGDLVYDCPDDGPGLLDRSALAATHGRWGLGDHAQRIYRVVDLDADLVHQRGRRPARYRVVAVTLDRERRDHALHAMADSVVHDHRGGGGHRCQPLHTAGAE